MVATRKLVSKILGLREMRNLGCCFTAVSKKVCVTWNMFAVGCFFHVYCLICQLVYLSHFNDTV